jgi:hypothetical protein
MISSVRETAEQILSHSKRRWLNPTEIFVLLAHEPQDTGLHLQINPIINPKGSAMILVCMISITIPFFLGFFRWSVTYFRRSSICST